MIEGLELQLREEIDLLRERIRQLEKVIGVPAIAPAGLGLRPLEARVLSHLMRMPEATKDSLMVALYGHLPETPPEPNVIGVVICRLRKLLGPRGMKIETLWGRGYKLPVATKRQLALMMENQNAA